MDPQEYATMFAAEEEHWWYLGMETLTNLLLRRFVMTGADARILDAGCGTGAALSTYLRAYGSVTGVDVSSLALGYCHRRTSHGLAQASVESLPFAAECFDLVTSFDVLYEQDVLNDAGAVGEFARVLKPGGFVLLRLPAYDWLRGQHDVVIHTARRYTARRVKNLLQQNGFTVEHLSYANMALFPAALVKRLLEKAFPPRISKSDLVAPVGGLNTLLRKILSTEARMAASVGLPFGLSVVALGRKRG